MVKTVDRITVRWEGTEVEEAAAFRRIVGPGNVSRQIKRMVQMFNRWNRTGGQPTGEPT